MPKFLKFNGERLLLYIRVTPGAARSDIDGEWHGPDGDVRLAVRVAAPPEAGRANEAVIRLISKRIGLPKSAFSVAAGGTSRLKTLAIETAVAAEAVAARLLSA